MLAPGWEKNYEGRPPLYPMACLGRITTHCRLADGTYNVLAARACSGCGCVRGTDAGAGGFARREVELCEDDYPARRGRSSARPAAGAPRGPATAAAAVCPRPRSRLDQLLGNDVPLGVLTDVISYMLDIDLPQKQCAAGRGRRASPGGIAAGASLAGGGRAGAGRVVGALLPADIQRN